MTNKVIFQKVLLVTFLGFVAASIFGVAMVIREDNKRSK